MGLPARSRQSKVFPRPRVPNWLTAYPQGYVLTIRGAPVRSAKDVRGYHVEATDGKVGHVEDFLIDDDFRRILFLAIRVDGWVFGKEVLASPRLVSRVDWASSRPYVDTTRQ